MVAGAFVGPVVISTAVGIGEARIGLFLIGQALTFWGGGKGGGGRAWWKSKGNRGGGVDGDRIERLLLRRIV